MHHLFLFTFDEQQGKTIYYKKRNALIINRKTCLIDKIYSAGIVNEKNLSS